MMGIRGNNELRALRFRGAHMSGVQVQTFGARIDFEPHAAPNRLGNDTFEIESEWFPMQQQAAGWMTQSA